MIGLDSNVLVRYLVQDDVEQAKAATALIEGECTDESPGHVDAVVLAEIVWVLTSAYGYPKEAVEGVIRQLLRTTEIEIEGSDAAWAALRQFEAGAADFADHLIAWRNRASGCRVTYTFDRRAARERHFAVVP